MAEITFEIDVICEVCKTTLTASEYKGQLFVEPCEVCMDRAKDEGLDEGYEKGLNEKEK